MGMLVMSGPLSSVCIEGGRPPAKSGAGGSGRFGEPPYCDDGVPGRGPPFMSAGSYGTLVAGGRAYSLDPRGVPYVFEGLCDDRDDGRKGS